MLFFVFITWHFASNLIKISFAIKNPRCVNSSESVSLASSITICKRCLLFLFQWWGNLKLTKEMKEKKFDCGLRIYDEHNNDHKRRVRKKKDFWLFYLVGICVNKKFKILMKTKKFMRKGRKMFSMTENSWNKVLSPRKFHS